MLTSSLSISTGDKKIATMAENLNSQTETLLKKHLPDALEQLSKRHESFSEVIQYLEESYQTAQRTGGDKTVTEREAREYVAQGLTAILGDIETVAGTMDKTISSHGTAIDSITSQVQLVQFRLQSMKQQHQLQSLEGLKQPTRAGVPQRIMQDRHEEEQETVLVGGKERQEEGGTGKRPTFEERMSRLNSVGIGSHP